LALFPSLADHFFQRQMVRLVKMMVDTAYKANHGEITWLLSSGIHLKKSDENTV